MDDGWGSHNRPQSPGHDIGPDEDRHPAEGTPENYYDNNSHDCLDTQQINHHSNFTYVEHMDETPRRPTSSSWINVNDIDLLYLETKRLETFEGYWQDSYYVLAADLAKHGFFYTGPGDKVKCVFCLKTLWNWEPNDSVEDEHKKHYPNCPFVKGQCEHLNVPIKPVNNMKRSLGIHMKLQTNEQNVFAPSNYSDRLKSYQNWPQHAPVRPEALTEAGFFYLGSDDQVKCFSCEQVLMHWQPGDDPWLEHVKVSQDCPYLLTVKGTDFVNQAHELLIRAENKSHCSSNEMPVSDENKSIFSHSTEEEKPQEVKPLLHVEELHTQIENDLKNPAVIATMDILEVTMEQMRRQLEQIRITKGFNYRLSANDLQDVSDV